MHLKNRGRVHLGKNPQADNVECLRHFPLFRLPPSINPFPSHSLPLHLHLPREGWPDLHWMSGAVVSLVSPPHWRGNQALPLDSSIGCHGEDIRRLEHHCCSVAGTAVWSSVSSLDWQRDCEPGCPVTSGSCLFSESDPAASCNSDRFLLNLH